MDILHRVHNFLLSTCRRVPIRPKAVHTLLRRRTISILLRRIILIMVPPPQDPPHLHRTTVIMRRIIKPVVPPSMWRDTGRLDRDRRRLHPIPSCMRSSSNNNLRPVERYRLRLLRMRVRSARDRRIRRKRRPFCRVVLVVVNRRL